MSLEEKEYTPSAPKTVETPLKTTSMTISQPPSAIPNCQNAVKYPPPKELHLEGKSPGESSSLSDGNSEMEGAISSDKDNDDEDEDDVSKHDSKGIGVTNDDIAEDKPTTSAISKSEVISSDKDDKDDEDEEDGNEDDDDMAKHSPREKREVVSSDKDNDDEDDYTLKNGPKVCVSKIGTLALPKSRQVLRGSALSRKRKNKRKVYKYKAERSAKDRKRRPYVITRKNAESMMKGAKNYLPGINYKHLYKLFSGHVPTKCVTECNVKKFQYHYEEDFTNDKLLKYYIDISRVADCKCIAQDGAKAENIAHIGKRSYVNNIEGQTLETKEKMPIFPTNEKTSSVISDTVKQFKYEDRQKKFSRNFEPTEFSSEFRRTEDYTHDLGEGSFNTTKEILEHMRRESHIKSTQHKYVKKMMCIICDKEFSTPESFVKHNIENHDAKPPFNDIQNIDYEELENFNPSYISYLLKHFNFIRRKYFKCIDCHEILESENERKIHIQITNHGCYKEVLQIFPWEKQYRCRCCGCTFGTRSLARFHIMTKHFWELELMCFESVIEELI